MAPGTQRRASLGHAVSSTSATPTSSSLTSQARNAFQSSFAKFEQTVQKLTPDDHREFSSTTLQDVRKAAREIERQLAARQCLRNMRRIEPLLNGLESYSKVVEVLCNGTPYLSWIWAPIKLVLKLSADFTNAFEKLIAAYGQIADCLPRFDRLSKAIDDPDFQRVLAVVYCDILEFHRRSYKFFRKSGWKCFFNSSWARFEGRFRCILDSLSRHADLVDREANAFSIAETLQWRQEALEEAVRRDRERSAAQFTAVLTWLNLETIPHCGQYNQDNILDRLTSDCYAGTTEWIVKHPKMKAWLKRDRVQPILWVKGKPGAGKSTLCAKLAQFLRTDGHSTVLFCFYTYYINGTHPHPSVFILSTLISQILRQNQGLSGYVYTDFVAKALSPSMQNLKEILSNLLPQTKSPRLLIDGIDECVDYDPQGKPRDLNTVKDVMRDIFQLNGNSISHVKLLLVSRDILQLTGVLSKKPTLSLDDEECSVRNAIRLYTTQRLSEIRDQLENVNELDPIFTDLEDKIVQKSQGMFLWVRLVLLQLEDDAYNMNDLETAIANLPVGLNEFYARIVARLKLFSPQSQERAARILQWMICARRPLRIAELQDAIAFDKDNFALTDMNKLPDTVINLCKPLIQRLDNNTVAFVHFTVQTYLISSTFIRKTEAERKVAFACLAYLEFSLNLIDPMISDQDRTITVGKGFHSLQSYIYEHWIDHVLAYAAGDNEYRVEDAPFHEHMNRLLHRLQRHRLSADADRPFQEFDISKVHEPRLAFLAHHPSLLAYLGRVIQQRTIARLHFGDDTIEASKVGSNTNTPLDTVHADYNNRVHVLLQSQTFSGLSDAQLATFKMNHGPFAFACRFPGCSNILTGFPTDELRVQHERLHAPPLLCTYSQCTYTLSFGSLQSLKRHIRENHGTATIDVPRKIRGTSNLLKERSFARRTLLPSNGVTSSSTSRDLTPRKDAVPEDNLVLDNWVKNPIIDPPPGDAPASYWEAWESLTSGALMADIQQYNSDLAALQKMGKEQTQDDHSNYPCNWCLPNVRFATLYVLMAHEKRKHFRIQWYPASKRCIFCEPENSPAIDSVETYYSHLRTVHHNNQEAREYRSHLEQYLEKWDRQLRTKAHGKRQQSFPYMYRCNWCDEAEFEDLEDLATHERSHDTSQPFPVTRNCLFCPSNGLLVDTVAHYRAHIRLYHEKDPSAGRYSEYLKCLPNPTSMSESPRPSGGTSGNNQEPSESPSNEQYPCHWCIDETFFPTFEALKVHEQSHVNEVRTECRHCLFCLLDGRPRTPFVDGKALFDHIVHNHHSGFPESEYTTHLSNLWAQCFPIAHNIRGHQCTWCAQGFLKPQLDRITQHEKESHKYYESLPNAAICLFCPDQIDTSAACYFETVIAYHYHLTSAHSEDPVACEYSNHLKEVESRAWRKSKKRWDYQCHWCRKVHVSLDELMSHEAETHDIDAPLAPTTVCMVCSSQGLDAYVEDVVSYSWHLARSHDKDKDAMIYRGHLGGSLYYCGHCSTKPRFETFHEMEAHDEARHQPRYQHRDYLWPIPCTFCPQASFRGPWMTSAYGHSSHLFNDHQQDPQAMEYRRHLLKPLTM